MSYFLKYKTDDEDDTESFATFVAGDRMRLRVKFTQSGTLQMILTNITKNQTYVEYLNSSVTGIDLTPTKLILGADETNSNHLESLKIEKISVK